MQAITSLRGLPKTPQIYSLMGKIQFKAKDFKGSAESLKQAIYLAVRDDIAYRLYILMTLQHRREHISPHTW